MSLLRSILQQSTDRRSFSRAYELPLYNNDRTTIPPPLTESVFPASPVVDELHGSTIRLEETRSKPNELIELQRRERYLQERLQRLLDAQADGLLAGLSGGQEGDGDAIEDGSFRSGSSTPTMQSPRRGSSRHSGREEITRPREKKIGLGAARKRIYQTIKQLSAVKAEEDEFLASDQIEDEHVLEQIDAWERKRSGLQHEMKDIEEQDQGQNARTLQEEADKLGTEIQDMEIRLAQMKTRHRQMLDELTGIENAVQSKLSSYKSSLSTLEKDIKDFLRTAPDRAKQDHSGARTSPFLLLPPKRRTLSMAKEYWQDKLNDLERAKKDNEVEREALDEGAGVWKEVVNTVTDFEGILKQEVALLARESDKSKLEERTEDLLSRMSDTLNSLEERLKLAEEKDWKLLMCCIGAELEAFKQGKEILESLLKPKDLESNGHVAEAGPSKQAPRVKSPPSRSSPRRPIANSSPQPAKEIVSAASDSDDDPDPELLISHQQDAYDD